MEKENKIKSDDRYILHTIWKCEFDENTPDVPKNLKK